MQINKPLITRRQFLIMAFIGGMVIKGFMLPSLLMLDSGKDGIFVMLFYFIVEIINLAVIAYIITAFPDKTLFQLLEECFGKVLSRVMALAFVLAALLKFVLNLSEVKAFFTLSMFSSVRWEFMIIPLIALCLIIGAKSLRILGRCAEVFFPFIAICIVLLSLILFKEVNFENLFPMLERGVEPILGGINEFPIWFGDIMFLSVAMGNVKNRKKLVWYSVLVRAVVAVMILAFALVLFATYANIVPLIKYGHTITSLTQYNLGSQEYGRFDLLIYTVWLFGVFLKMSMNFYFGIRCLSFVFKKDNFLALGGVLAVASYILSIFVFPSVADVYVLSTNPWVKYLFSFMEYIFPVCLLIIAKIKYRKGNKEQNYGQAHA